MIFTHKSLLHIIGQSVLPGTFSLEKLCEKFPNKKLVCLSIIDKNVLAVDCWSLTWEGNKEELDIKIFKYYSATVDPSISLGYEKELSYLKYYNTYRHLQFNLLSIDPNMLLKMLEFFFQKRHGYKLRN